MNLYRGRVARAIQGKRGQTMLRDLKVALEALPERRLIARTLVDLQGSVCALGALAQYRGITIEPRAEAEGDEDVPMLARSFDVAECLVREVIWQNDDAWGLDPAELWQWMHRWVCEQLDGAPERYAP